MAMNVDAIDGVSLPNALRMSQHADGGVGGTKPHIASDRHIARIGNCCTRCRYGPAQASGADACPFTTLYRDFPERHRDRLADNPRMRYPLQNRAAKDVEERVRIRGRAAEWLDRLDRPNRSIV